MMPSELRVSARSTVAEAIKALEAAGLLTWVNRLTRIWESELDMFGQWTTRRRMIRTSSRREAVSR
jgi:hypothetical protein